MLCNSMKTQLFARRFRLSTRFLGNVVAEFQLQAIRERGAKTSQVIFRNCENCSKQMSDYSKILEPEPNRNRQSLVRTEPEPNETEPENDITYLIVTYRIY